MLNPSMAPVLAPVPDLSLALELPRAAERDGSSARAARRDPVGPAAGALAEPFVEWIARVYRKLGVAGKLELAQRVGFVVPASR